jgi:hypothetical protein
MTDVTVAGKPARRRRLVRWEHLDPRGGRHKFVFDDGTKSDVTPIRFVCACQKGHLQDIDWNGSCTAPNEPMWVEEKGTSANPADTSVVRLRKATAPSGIVRAGSSGQLPR